MCVCVYVCAEVLKLRKCLQCCAACDHLGKRNELEGSMAQTSTHIASGDEFGDGDFVGAAAHRSELENHFETEKTPAAPAAPQVTLTESPTRRRREGSGRYCYKPLRGALNGAATADIDRDERMQKMLEKLKRQRESAELQHLRNQWDLKARRKQVRNEICYFCFLFVVFYLACAMALLMAMRISMNQPLRGTYEDMLQVVTDLKKLTARAVGDVLDALRYAVDLLLLRRATKDNSDAPRPTDFSARTPNTNAGSWSHVTPGVKESVQLLQCRAGDAKAGYRPLRVCPRVIASTA